MVLWVCLAGVLCTVLICRATGIQGESNLDKRSDVTFTPSKTGTVDDYVISSLAESSMTGQIGAQTGGQAAVTRQASLPLSCDPNPSYRTIDGRCNNMVNPEWGSTQQPFKRYLEPQYADGLFMPRVMSNITDTPLPSPREVSSTVHNNRRQVERGQSVLVMQWGQFIDHDLTGTPLEVEDVNLTCCVGLQPGEEHPDMESGGPCFPIFIPENDPHFQKRCMDFIRSAAAPRRASTEPREQFNLLTSLLDASMVYGLTEEQSLELRDGAFLKTKGENLLPESPDDICLLENEDDWCFAAGDERVNVFPGLSVLHTIFMREHNRLVHQLMEILPEQVDEEEIFQEARKIVGAIIQHITYTEWLPVIIGSEAVKEYKLDTQDVFTYEPTRNPNIANVFATAAFRFGHSTIPRFLRLRGRKVLIDNLFNRPTEVIRDLDAVLESILMDRRQSVDRFVTDMMTDQLFHTEGENSFDIVSLNLQRGRDHGLPSYNDFRRFCNLEPKTSFADFDDGGRAFSRVYSHPDDVDVFSGAVSEEAVDGSVGPLLACLIGRQFQDLKYGDAFWYETQDEDRGFTPDQLSEIRRVTLAKVLCENSAQGSIQADPFKVYNRRGNPTVSCCEIPTMDISKWTR